MRILRNCLARWGISAVILVCVGPAEANATEPRDKSLQGIACRSVHLQYRLPAIEESGATVGFFNEVRIQQSAPGTYFCAGGFSRGYFGFQELANGRKLLIFSVWDPGSQNDPNQVIEEQRVRLLYRDPDVRVGRFGNEGTGGQSFFDYDWELKQSYRVMVSSRRSGERTEYAGWFFHPEQKAWRKLVVFSTLTKDKELRGLYAFVEDFRRNRVSAAQTRSAEFCSPRIIGSSGSWRTIRRAQFTADQNPVLNINAAPGPDRFLLETGGDLTSSTPLRTIMRSSDSENAEELTECLAAGAAAIRAWLN